MVVALVALLFSVSGNAIAFSGLITGKNIKDGTIQMVDLSPAARSALRSSPKAAAPARSLEARVTALEMSVNSVNSMISSTFGPVQTTKRQMANICSHFGRVVADVNVSSSSNRLSVTYAHCG
jgi:hypothetical protein